MLIKHYTPKNERRVDAFYHAIFRNMDENYMYKAFVDLVFLILTVF